MGSYAGPGPGRGVAAGTGDDLPLRVHRYTASTLKSPHPKGWGSFRVSVRFGYDSPSSLRRLPLSGRTRYGATRRHVTALHPTETTLAQIQRRPPTRHYALSGAISNLEPPTGIEPVTYALRERRSAY